jgi:branched-chain amino acid aminotransferase
MTEATGFIWLNGSILKTAEAHISPADRGLLLGDGLFETLLARNGAACDTSLHFARLTAGAALLRLTLPFDEAAFTAALAATLHANTLQNSVLRLTLTRGAAPRGLLPPPGTPTALITAAPLPPAAGPVSVIISKTIRRDETSPLSAIKSLNYLPNILARMEAAERGADDALLLNHAGRLAEATAGNLFIRLQGEWLTPPVFEGALPGIRRAKLLASGAVREAEIGPASLSIADTICIGNVLGLRPVTKLNGTPIRSDDAAILALTLM